MPDALLNRLKGAKAPLSGTALAEEWGVTRAAIHKRIQKLRAGGNKIEGTNRVGYRWGGNSQRLKREALKGGIVKDVIYFKSLKSTQDEAKALGAQGAAEGTLIIADRQTAGRGRLGRSWMSPPGGLWYSLLLRPAVLPEGVPALTLVAALDWVEVLRARGVPAGVKWPNDVWAEGKKVAGILTEMSAETDRVHWVSLGVGVNVNNAPPISTSPPAASVSDWLGPTELEDLWEEWRDHFSKSYVQFCQFGFGPFRAPFEKRSLLTGTTIFFMGTEGRNSGRVLGIDEAGRLRVSTSKGIVACSGGEVSLLRPVQGPVSKRTR